MVASHCRDLSVFIAYPPSSTWPSSIEVNALNTQVDRIGKPGPINVWHVVIGTLEKQVVAMIVAVRTVIAADPNRRHQYEVVTASIACQLVCTPPLAKVKGQASIRHHKRTSASAVDAHCPTLIPEVVLFIITPHLAIILTAAVCAARVDAG